MIINYLSKNIVGDKMAIWSINSGKKNRRLAYDWKYTNDRYKMHKEIMFL